MVCVEVCWLKVNLLHCKQSGVKRPGYRKSAETGRRAALVNANVLEMMMMMSVKVLQSQSKCKESAETIRRVETLSVGSD